MTEVPEFLINHIARNDTELPEDIEDLILDRFHEPHKYCRDEIFLLELDVYGRKEPETPRQWFDRYRQRTFYFNSVGPSWLYSSQEFISKYH